MQEWKPHRSSAARNASKPLLTIGATVCVLAAAVASSTGARAQQDAPSRVDEASASARPRLARATLEPTAGHGARGRVELVQTPDGLFVDIRLSGLTPGRHGLHIHEHGDCSAPDAASTGDHFSPADDPHGAPADPAGQHHAGDLGNVTADDSGTATGQLTARALSLEPGAVDVVGRAVVVHAGEDDLSSQPAGDSGEPAACGVIELVAPRRG